jgi:hypothetical protein
MTMRIYILLLAPLALIQAGLAQGWEAGASGGVGFTNQLAVSNVAGRASAGFTGTAAASGYLGQDLYRYLGGEVRYTFRPSDLQLSSGAGKVRFDGLSHALHYDLVVHNKPAGSPARLFLAAGAGFRVFRGTGRETAYQPLQEFALLTKTQEWKPLISIGGGVKVAVSSRLSFRAEFRDYVSPFPKKVITPSTGAKLSGWLHDIVPLAGISYAF